MAYVNGGNVKKGQFIIHNGAPNAVIKSDFVSPGKGSAFTRAKLRNLQTGSVIDFTFKTTEKVELADVESVEMQFIYSTGAEYVFMNPRSYEQFEIPADVVGEDNKFLKEEMTVYVQLYNGQPIGIFMPQKVVLEVTEAEDAVAGDRANAPKKPVIVETGAEVMAPLFVKKGDKLLIDTATGEYVSRAN
ncbi:elongation factor P [Candidatus Woesebacteria bacterium]|nr:elongation factor P [Candidatus Woesebacteria bacterium]MCD8507716.1 elongation factor P [Candidatus Woesebacteria bacterium]MCD8527138.1 elongation factor P [Candidatus Woesebacteria bacterium]MCD8546825.1 elongation factor P [Candidatus Woesebacteria bacterium]